MRFRNQSQTPHQLMENVLQSRRKLRYRPFFIRIIAWLDRRRALKLGRVTPAESPYERVARAHFNGLKLKIKKIAVMERNMLEAVRNSSESDMLKIVDRQSEVENELKDAKAKLEKSHHFGFSAWRFRSVVRLVVLFAIEIPLNLAAFMGIGDSLPLMVSSTLSVSVAVPSATHAAGKLIKADKRISKIIGFGFVTLLVALILSISILRRDAFESVARDYAGIVTSSSFIVALFYFLVQCLFIAVAIEMSHSYTEPVDEAARGEWKERRARYALARKISKNTEISLLGIDHKLTDLQSRLALNAEMETVSLHQLESEYREIVEIYRRTRWPDGDGMDSTTPGMLENPIVPTVQNLKASECDPANGSRLENSILVSGARTPNFGNGNGGSL